MSDLERSHSLLDFIVDRVNVGVFVVDRQMNVVLWNRFMETYSGKEASEVVGRNLFACFADLPVKWLQRKIENVFLLENFSFTSWEQRPYLFRFRHNRPVTGGVDSMRQNCTFLPVKIAGHHPIEHVCITLFDVTDTSIYQGMLHNALKSLADVSNRDGLTGVYNRRYLEASIAQEFARCQRYGPPMSVILLDIDFFKKVNDQRGHQAGDEVLKIVAQRLGGCLRDSDMLARYGGEEFAIILPETELTGALSVAERLRSAVADTPISFHNDLIPVTISLGVSQFRVGVENCDSLVHEADTALYQSKEKGRNCVTAWQAPRPELSTVAAS